MSEYEAIAGQYRQAKKLDPLSESAAEYESAWWNSITSTLQQQDTEETNIVSEMESRFQQSLTVDQRVQLQHQVRACADLFDLCKRGFYQSEWIWSVRRDAVSDERHHAACFADLTQQHMDLPQLSAFWSGGAPLTGFGVCCALACRSNWWRRGRRRGRRSARSDACARCSNSTNVATMGWRRTSTASAAATTTAAVAAAVAAAARTTLLLARTAAATTTVVKSGRRRAEAVGAARAVARARIAGSMAEARAEAAAAAAVAAAAVAGRGRG